MIKSMTGYGKAEAALGHKKITVEIRSLNSKQTDLAVKLPALYRPQEYEIRNLVAKRLQRGKIDVYITVELAGSQNSVTLNKQAFDEYYTQLMALADGQNMAWGTKAVDAALLQVILRLPDVVQTETTTLSDEENHALMKAVEEALNHIEAFREQEGAILIADLLKRIDKIESLKNGVEPYEKARTETIKARIRENIEAIGIPLDSNRLEQEMIYYIEKLDITEEKVRLQNHCNYFREVARSEEGVGRKLGFIAQELGREINTLGSKANEATMQKMVVEMKDELEKIKEQLLNILFSAPSGAGKSTIIGRLLRDFPQLEFSISATSRAPRGKEVHGCEYYFLDHDDFLKRAGNGEFVEWEEVYAGTCYGTLRSELERIWSNGHVIVFDVDVKGGVNLKKIFGKQALSVFIMPPSVEVLHQRLVDRGTDSPEMIAKRVAKATEELTYANQFDCIVVNDCLATAVEEAKKAVAGFIE